MESSNTKPWLVLLGGLLLVFARRIVAVAERLAFENPAEASPRSSTLPAARIEGLVAMAIGVRGRWPSALVRLFVVTGTALVVEPRRALRAGLSVAYRNPDAIRVRRWVVPATRLAGVAHVGLAFRALRTRAAEIDHSRE